MASIFPRSDNVKNPVKRKLREGGCSIGSWITIASPTIAELMGNIGFEWLGIDCEHAAIGLESTQVLMQAMAGTCATPIVRVATNDHVMIKRVLDMGADGIMVPMVNSAAEAEQAVRATRFPPRGVRGVGLARAHGYTVENRAEYLNEMDEEVLLIIQCEHRDSVKSIGEILKVDGYDGIFVGHDDMAASMGLLGHPEHPDVVSAIETVLKAAKNAGVAVGIPARTAEETQMRLEQGFRFIQLGVDVLYLGDGCKEKCRDMCRRGYGHALIESAPQL
jgi:4-hydroxy-2-oxoheptanedioate aldolase